MNLVRKLAAEVLGTALLVATVIGSGIMAENLSAGNEAIALLGNTLATGAVLIVLILIFSPISGGHFNPAVSFSFVLQGQLSWRNFAIYSIAQVTGGILGAILAHLMFDLPTVTFSINERYGLGIWIGEIVASFGLLLTILGCLRTRPETIPYAVGLFITAGYWFTSSTSFANPAVTIARSLTDTFSGIRINDVGYFILAQILGSYMATQLHQWFWVKNN